MNKNTKIAKELVKIAKSLTAFDEYNEEDIIQNSLQFIDNKSFLKKYSLDAHIDSMKKIIISNVMTDIKICINVQYEYGNNYNNIFISEFKDGYAITSAYYLNPTIALETVMTRLSMKRQDFINKLDEIIKPFERKINDLQADLINKPIYFTDYVDLFEKLDGLLNDIENYFEQKDLIYKQIERQIDIQCKKLQQEADALDIEEDMDKDQFDRDLKDIMDREDFMEERWLRGPNRSKSYQHELQKKPYMTDRRQRRRMRQQEKNSILNETDDFEQENL